MTPVLFIAIRFFLENRRAMALSALGVIFGVAFFITGQAQTQGFESYFIKTMLGSKGAVLISDRFQDSFNSVLNQEGGDVVVVNNPQTRKYYQGIDDAKRMIDVLLTFPNVRACSPIIQKPVTVRTGFRSEVATLQGIVLDAHVKATDFVKHLTSGTLEDFRDLPDAVAVGSILAERLEIKTGLNLYVLSPTGDTRRFKVTNIFETGVNSIDERVIFTHRRAAQTTLNEPFLTSIILVQLHDSDRAREDAIAFEDLFFHSARAWQDRERGILAIFTTLRISAGLGISAIILLAGFGIFNILTMSVLEKTKEIAILRSMGYTPGDIALVFVLQGLGIAVIGILLGWITGAALTYGVSFIPLEIRGVFKTDTFIVEWAWEHYVLAAVLALISVIIASYIPARRASNVKPVHILRGTSN